MTASTERLLPPQAPPRPRLTRTTGTALALIAASLPMFMSTLDNLVMTTALPVIRADLSASLEQLQWMVNAYTLSFASLMIAAATLGDRIGRRRMFIVGIAVFGAGSVVSALAGSAGMLIAARAVQGAGAAAIMPLSLTLLASAVTKERRAMAIGIWGAVSGLGVALGPVIGGAIVDGISWQAIFWLNVPVALVSIPLIFRALPESFGKRQRLDLAGMFLAGIGVLSIVWGVIRGNDDGWTSAPVLIRLALGAALLATFIWRERRTDHPLVPLRMFAVRSFTIANVTSFAFAVGVFGVIFVLSQYLQIGLGYTPLQAGLRTLPWTAAPMVVAPLAGLLAPRVGVRPLLMVGLAFQAAGLAWIGLLIQGGTTSYPDFVPGLVLAGVGMGLTFAPSATAVLADMREAEHGTASSVNATVREVGAAIGVASIVAVFQAAGGTLTPTGYAEGLGPAMLVGAAIIAVAAVAARWMPAETGRQGSTQPAETGARASSQPA